MPLILAVAPIGGKGPRRAAAVGAVEKSLWMHDGDPEHSLVSLGRVVNTLTAGPAWDLWTLDDAGDLRRRAFATDVDILVQDHVRAAFPVDITERVIWQAMTDDIVEPVYLRDLVTGADIQLSTNEFTPVAWGRDYTVSSLTGHWSTTHDGAYLALIGPDGRFARVYRGDTGEATPVPEHLEYKSYYKDGFWLKLADPDPTVQVDARSYGGAGRWPSTTSPIAGLSLARTTGGRTLRASSSATSPATRPLSCSRASSKSGSISAARAYTTSIARPPRPQVCGSSRCHRRRRPPSVSRLVFATLEGGGSGAGVGGWSEASDLLVSSSSRTQPGPTATIRRRPTPSGAVRRGRWAG